MAAFALQPWTLSRDPMAHKAKNVYSLDFQKLLLTLGLEEEGKRGNP